MHVPKHDYNGSAEIKKIIMATKKIYKYKIYGKQFVNIKCHILNETSLRLGLDSGNKQQIRHTRPAV